MKIGGGEVAALLCPGPSLANLEPAALDQYNGHVMAINSAIQFPAIAKWWHCSDWQAYRNAYPIPTRQWPFVTLPNEWLDPRHPFRIDQWPEPYQSWFISFGHITYDVYKIVRESQKWLGPWQGWRTFSSLTGLMLLITWGFRRVVMYGCDLSGNGHYGTGWEYAPEVVNGRWNRESDSLNRVLTGSQRLGIQVVRVNSN